MAHVPVLLNEVITALQPRPGACYLDATVGAGGHAEAILRASAPDGRLLGTDADAAAIARTAARLNGFGPRLALKQAWLDDAAEVARVEGWVPLDGILADLGLSSDQLDDAERGLSFQRDGPLDMRFDRTHGPTAADLVNESDVYELTMLLRDYGEVRNARRVAEALWAARPVTTTAALRDAVLGVRRPKPGQIHPATLVFQALRIAVNDELRRLADALPRLVDALAPGGRLAVISFHSLEDRIVKRFFRTAAQAAVDGWPAGMPGEEEEDEADTGGAAATGQARVSLITRKPIEATAGEVSANPRARSAKLRVVERIHAGVV